MNVSEDGTVTGSIDHSKLGEVEPKTDEARAQLDALKTEREVGQRQADAEVARRAEPSPLQDTTRLDGDEADEAKRSQQAEAAKSQPAQSKADNTAKTAPAAKR